MSIINNINNKEYYLSNYVILQKINDQEYILIHSYLNNIDIIDNQIADKLIKIKNHQNVDNFDQKIVSELLSKGYLIENQIDDKNRFLSIVNKLAEQKNNNSSYILIPSYNCNFSCPYCFEGNITRHKNNILMDDKMIDIIFDIINKEQKNKNGVSLSLFGGEPLLKENIVINKYIFDKAKETGLKISVITNGYDLDHYISYIKEDIFSSFQITLDGDKLYHNKTKFTKFDNDTFSKVLSNIEIFLKTKTKSSIKVRINTNKDNINSLKKLQQTLIDKGFLDDSRFSFYTKSVDECSGRKNRELSDVDIIHNISFFDDKIKNMKTNSQYAFIIDEINSIFDLKRKFGNYKVKFCGATGNNKLIDPYGNVYSCLEEVGKPDRRVGFIDKENREIRYTPLMDEWRNRSVKNINECSVCEYALICGTGCGIAAYKYKNSLKSPWCGKNKEIISEVVCEIASKLG